MPATPIEELRLEIEVLRKRLLLLNPDDDEWQEVAEKRRLAFVRLADHDEEARAVMYGLDRPTGGTGQSACCDAGGEEGL